MLIPSKILVEGEKFDEFYKKAKENPEKLQAQIGVALEKSLDSVDELTNVVKDQGNRLDDHCKAPASLAHPPHEREAEDLTPGQRYRIAMMEHRGKIITTVAGVIVGIFAVVFKGGI